MVRLPTAVLPSWRYWPALGLAALILIAALSSWIQPLSQPAETEQQQRPTEETDKKDPPLILIRIGSVVGDWIDGNSRAIEAVSAALLLVVTVILGWIAYRQFTTTRAELRAYLMPQEVSVRVGSNGITVYVTMKNYGQTPAARVSTSTSITVTPEKIPEPHIRPSTYTVGPGATFEMDRARQVGEEKIGSIKEGRETAFFRAKVVYEDAFGKARHTDMQGRFQTRRGEWILRPTEENNGHS